MNDIDQTRSGVREYFRRRFEVSPSLWKAYRVRLTGSSVFLLGRGITRTSTWDREETGLRIASLTSHAFKPSTRGVQWFGNRLRTNRVPLTREQFRNLLDRRKLHGVATDDVTSRGYVAVFFRGWAIGCCFWTGEALRTQLPKALSRQCPEAIFDIGDKTS